MITKVRIENINSIDVCEIDFLKSKYKYFSEMIFKETVVNPISFYGTNGSGKSSFLKAVAQLVTFFIDEPDQITPFLANYINVESEETKDKNHHKILIVPRRDKSSVTLWFILDNDMFSYKLETEINGVICYEKLTKNKDVVFERKITKFVYKCESNKLDRSLFPLLRKLAIEKNDETITKCFNFISNIAFIDANSNHISYKLTRQKSYKDIIVEKSKQVNDILASYREFPLYEIMSKTNQMGQKEYFVSIEGNDKDVVLPYGLMSNGMMAQSLFLSTLLTLPENGVMIIDEIEDALHPLTIIDFINVVRRKNIQLIFSSHNTYILQKLRPDQIFFANWKNGSSAYKRLSTIYPNIREINNIEKMYLANLFDEEINDD